MRPCKKVKRIAKLHYLATREMKVIFSSKVVVGEWFGMRILMYSDNFVFRKRKAKSLRMRLALRY